MLRAVFASVLGASLVLGGCRSCDAPRGGAADAAPAGPTMPAGMLLPNDNDNDNDNDAPSAAAPRGTSELRIARHVEGGAFTELQVARPGDRADRRDFERWRDGSSFVSLAAMTLLHEPFARALPGFDLFLPRLFAGDALAKLASELDAFAARTQGDIAAVAREIATLARATSAKGSALWVLGI